MDTNLTSQTTKNGRFLFLVMPLSALFIVAFSVMSCFPSTNYYPSLASATKQLTSHFNTHKILKTRTAVLYCDGALYQDLCVSTLTRIAPDITSKSLPEIISATVDETISQVQSMDINVGYIRKNIGHLSLLETRALEDCHTLFLETVSQLKNAASYLSEAGKFNDIQTMLSSAMTNLDTCLDGFEGSKSQKVSQDFHNKVKGISHQVSNSLALLKKANQTPLNEAFQEHGDDKSGMSM